MAVRGGMAVIVVERQRRIAPNSYESSMTTPDGREYKSVSIQYTRVQ